MRRLPRALMDGPHARDAALHAAAHRLRSALNGISTWAQVLETQLPGASPGVRAALDGIFKGVAQQLAAIEALEAEATSPPPAVTPSPKGHPEEVRMNERKSSRPGEMDRKHMREEERPDRPQPPTDEGPGERHEAKGEEDARNKTTRRGER